MGDSETVQLSLKDILGDYETIFSAREDCNYTSQTDAFIALMRGDNVFLSGPAGSGKSYVVNKYLDLLNKKFLNVLSQKTSTTGISAANIGGVTIHSFSGMGITNLKFEDATKDEVFLKRLLYKETIIQDYDIIVIDEISMLSKRSFEFVAKMIERSNDKYNKYNKNFPKKIQVIVMGDFSQLPPVNPNPEPEFEDCGEFCYGSDVWNRFHFTELYLDKLYRTKDPTLSNLLNSIANGDGATIENKQVLNSMKTTFNEFEEGSTLLLTTNKNVDKVNKEEQSKNKGREVVFKTLYSFKQPFPNEEDEKFVKQNNIPDELLLKEGDTVMVTSNLSFDSLDFAKELPPPQSKITNGMIGTFFIEDVEGIERWGVKFKKDGKQFGVILNPLTVENKVSIPIKDTNGKVIQVVEETKGVYTQYPLKLAYAITVHKSQGQTFSNVTIDLTKCWTEGLGYVALSRATSFDGITLLRNPQGYSYTKNALIINPESIKIREGILGKAKKYREEFPTDFDINKTLEERFKNKTLRDLEESNPILTINVEDNLNVLDRNKTKKTLESYLDLNLAEILKKGEDLSEEDLNEIEEILRSGLKTKKIREEREKEGHKKEIFSIIKNLQGLSIEEDFETAYDLSLFLLFEFIHFGVGSKDFLSDVKKEINRRGELKKE